MRLKKLKLAAGMLLSAVGFLAAAAQSAATIPSQIYTFKENVHVGQVIPNDGITDIINTDATSNAVTETKYITNVVETVTEVKDGSPVAAKLFVDPQSYHLQKNPGDPNFVRTANSYAGQTTIARRKEDGSIVNDFKGNADPEDTQQLNAFVDPDEDLYPATPVAVGDVWDVTPKMREDWQIDLRDQFSAQVRLDSIKQIDGKSFASMSLVAAGVHINSDKSEQDVNLSMVFLVNVEHCQIVKVVQDVKETDYAGGAGTPVTNRGTTHFETYIPGEAPGTKPGSCAIGPG